MKTSVTGNQGERSSHRPYETSVMGIQEERSPHRQFKALSDKGFY
ncbi:hypothetical protein [Sutcliffiella horikoshii]|nr:hypothetical protein [Sutcliffiella horikoshii]